MNHFLLILWNEKMSLKEVIENMSLEEEIEKIGYADGDNFRVFCKIKKLTPEIIEEMNKYAHVIFNGDFNDDLTKKEGDEIVSVFSQNVKSLEFRGSFDKPLDILSPSIDTIYLECRRYRHPLDNLPDTLMGLQLGHPRESRFGSLKLKAVTRKLPDSLEFLSLALRDLNNFELEKFPNNLKIFHFHYSEDLPFELPNLPQSIEELKLFDMTNYPFLNQSLPNFKKIIAGYFFNLPLDNLPIGLESIVIRQLSNTSTIAVGNFNQPLCKDGKTVLPDGLEELRLETHVLTFPIVDFPKNLKKLYLDVNCYYNLENLPEGLEDLTIFNRNSFPDGCSFDNLPSSLKILKVGYCNWEKPFDYLPANLEKLSILVYKFKHPVDNLPIGLKYLEVNLDGNQKINNLPLGLEYLRINVNSKYSQPVRNLPPSLKHFNCNNFFDSEIVELPESLKWVKVGLNYTFINDLKARYGDKVIVRPRRKHYDTITYDSYTG